MASDGGLNPEPPAPPPQVVLRYPVPNPRMPAYLNGTLAWGSPPTVLSFDGNISAVSRGGGMCGLGLPTHCAVL